MNRAFPPYLVRRALAFVVGFALAYGLAVSRP